jgi:hypothetical protein
MRTRSHEPTPRTTRRTRATLALVAALALIAPACTGDDDTATPTTSEPTTPTDTTEPTDTTTTDTTTGTTTSTTTGTTTTTPTTTTTTTTTSTTTIGPGRPSDSPGPSGLRSIDPFADYRWVPALPADARYGGPTTPTSLDDVLLTPYQQGAVERSWIGGADAIERLERNGFVVNADWGDRFFHDAYKSAAYWDVPLFVTTDALYHSWHLVFDRVLRDTEQQHLLPTLEAFLATAVGAARDQEVELAGTSLADDARRATAYYESAAVLAGVDVGEIGELAAEEVALVEAAAGIDASPITGSGSCEWPDSFVGCIDYSLFRPRGHYTRTPDLERYFRSMSLLGLEGFALDDGVGVVPGLLVTRIMVADPELLSGWRALYEPTAFLIGLADDVDPLQLAAAADDAIPGWVDDPLRLTAADAEAIAEAVLAAHPVAIDPERASVRVMGARFTLDSFVLDQLAWPNVGREPPEERRVFVSPLDLAAAFGSDLARERQLATESGFHRYTEQLDEMTELIAGRGPDDWAATVYDAWLAAIAPQFVPRGSAFPDFMRTDAWAAKALQTGLGSYTELKHDTVLYTKQGSAGEGEGPEPAEFVPRHWVEPDPVAFGRIAAAAALVRDGFDARGLLTDETDDLLATLIELSDWLAGIAADELAGEVADDADNARLLDIGSELEYLWIASSEIELNEYGYAVPDWDERAGLVTDVFTTSFEHLQLGTGNPEAIFVIVPLGDGRFELAQGAVMSYYEFWMPNDIPRLTDEEWRAMLIDDDLPRRPQWVDPFVVGADVATEPRVTFTR